MLPKKLAFVDIETTGGSFFTDRIIEIGILRVEDGVVIAQYNSFINPETYIPKEISLLTGITDQDVALAPTFSSVSRDLYKLLEDCVFVAHNARFDLSFLKQAFRRDELTFAPKHLCTVKLSRALYPHYRHHNLDSLIERFNLACPNRHRAFDDAAVLWQFLQMVTKTVSEDVITAAINRITKRPAIPPNLSEEDLDKLPESPGVYIFYGEEQIPLYVGKSINLKDRIRSHFAADQTDTKEMKIAQQVCRIETIVTSGELGALVKEAQLVKELKPLYNSKLRLKRELTVLTKKMTDQGYSTIELKRVNELDPNELANILAVYSSTKHMKNTLRHLCQEFSLCPRLVGLEPGKGSCFAYELERCQGACLGAEQPLFYNVRFAQAFANTKLKSWPFAGPVAIVEENELDDATHGYIVDKWCILREVELKKASQVVKDLASYLGTAETMQFDFDTYKILQSYFKSPKHYRHIYQYQGGLQPTHAF